MCGTTFDIIGVNETFCDDTVKDSGVSLDGFNILRKDRNRDGGGVALYINQCLDFKRRDDLCDDSVECIWVEISPPHVNSFLICSLYNHDGKNNDFANKLSMMLAKATLEDKELILLGDFNCDYSPHIQCKQVDDLKFVSNMYQLQQLIDRPTRITPHSRTIIYLFLHQGVSFSMTAG